MAIVDYFLKIDGISGESTDIKHKGEIQLDSWSFGLSNSATIGSETGGAGAGKASFQDFHFTSKISVASPKLMAASAAAHRIQTAVLSGRKRGGDGGGTAEFLKYTFQDVLVTSVSQAASGGEQLPEDAVSLAFAHIEVAVNEQKQTGTVVPPVTFSFDLIQNKIA